MTGVQTLQIDLEKQLQIEEQLLAQAKAARKQLKAAFNPSTAPALKQALQLNAKLKTEIGARIEAIKDQIGALGTVMPESDNPPPLQENQLDLKKLAIIGGLGLLLFG